MGDAEDNVKGGKEILLLAEKGLALFAAQEQDEVELDVPAATKFKEEADAKFAALEAEATALTGKDNKKARTEKSKEASEIKKTAEYIDAVKVIKGDKPKNGNFAKIKSAAKAAAAPAAAAADDKKDDKKKDDKKPKATGAAGISKDERDELEKLKNDLISRKKELKEGGMSGGQINKDPEIAGWVARMNELKEKENPGVLKAQKEEKKGGSKKKLSAEQTADKIKLEEEIEEYKSKLKTEFGYSAKDIKADPDLMDMQKKLADMK
jgi:hypothetical protein